MVCRMDPSASKPQLAARAVPLSRTLNAVEPRMSLLSTLEVDQVAERAVALLVYTALDLIAAPIQAPLSIRPRLLS